MDADHNSDEGDDGNEGASPRAPSPALRAAQMRAAAEANHSELKNKHGALLVRSGKVIGSGCNSSRSRLSQMPGDVNAVSLHSEVAALHASGMCLLRA